jgi:hypothetical protein
MVQQLHQHTSIQKIQSRNPSLIVLLFVLVYISSSHTLLHSPTLNLHLSHSPRIPFILTASLLKHTPRSPHMAITHASTLYQKERRTQHRFFSLFSLIPCIPGSNNRSTGCPTALLWTSNTATARAA